MSGLGALISKHEGFRATPYFDCCGLFFRNCKCEKQGKLTIGYGTNLEDVGLTPQEAELLRDNRITLARQAISVFPWFKSLSAARQAVLIDMTYCLGFDGIIHFRRMLTAVKKGDFKVAAAEMLDSDWRTQVGARANDLAAMMASGEFPPEKSPPPVAGAGRQPV